MSIAIETAEMMERFQWLITQEAQNGLREPTKHAAVADVLASSSTSA